jgi:cell shape-determining protein MreD
MDVHEAALFGEHALAYTLISYGAITLHRLRFVCRPDEVAFTGTEPVDQ